MRWQRAARWGVAVAGLGIAALLYFQTDERPPDERPPVAAPADPEARAQSAAGTVVRFSDGERTFELTHEGERVYADGRTQWDRARLTIGDGTLLAADLIEASAATGPDGVPLEIACRGNVRLDTPEGASVSAGEATYNSTTGVAVLPGPVAFTRGRVSGAGTGGEYHRDTGVFHVLADATIEMAADEGAEAARGSARTMTFDRASRALLLDGGARIEHERQIMTAELATLHMTDDGDEFRLIELRTGARVVPRPGYEADVPDMRARDIDLAFYDGTQALERGELRGGSSLTIVESGGRRSIEAIAITFNTGTDGRTLTHLEAHDRVVVRTPPSGDSPARTITSDDLVASGQEGRGLTSALFTGGVRFVEQVPAQGGAPAGERTGTAARLTLQLGGQLEAVERAHFERDARFRDGDVTGDADLGEYDAAAGRLRLRPARSPSRYPRVTSDRVTVDARELVDVDLVSRDLYAKGDVRTVSLPDDEPIKGGAERQAGFFDERDTVYGFADEFWYTDASGDARYRGSDGRPARVTQGETTVTAGTVTIRRQTRDLDAATSVVATFSTAGDGDEPPKAYRVESDTLEYRDAARTATYVGTPVVLTGPDGVTRAATMVMTLAEESREVERLDARGNVYSLMAEGHTALADTLLFEAPLERYTLRGAPLVLRMLDREQNSCSETRGRMAYYTVGEPSPEFPAPENRGGVARRNVACDSPLQK